MLMKRLWWIRSLDARMLAKISIEPQPLRYRL
jgi:hypothetical protein